ncbi:unknown [Coprobacillus sp. CAG:826]|jgi:hypothetical protein|nr:hypothetical protein [Coprobacillus sp.]CDD92314.1 unknown [Coprobacillus sp. CAG:826]
MKKFFGAIGRFFARIWRWIVETAWIQPLLIVGLIFGVVFSIPSISSWISNLSKSQNNYAFYNKNTVSTTDLLKYAESNDFSPLYDNDEDQHFLLVFIKKGCDSCETDEEAFKLFSTDWNDYKGNKKAPSVYFVYSDFDKDDDSTKATNYNKFVKEMNLFDTAIAYYLDTVDYYGKDVVSYSDDYISSMEDVIDPKAPTPMIVSFVGGYIDEVIMGLSPSNKDDDILRMQYLRNFYYHQDQFKNVNFN